MTLAAPGKFNITHRKRIKVGTVRASAWRLPRQRVALHVLCALALLFSIPSHAQQNNTPATDNPRDSSLPTSIQNPPPTSLRNPPPPPNILDPTRSGAASLKPDDKRTSAARPGSDPDDRPFAARLAAPTAGREDDLDEIIVTGNGLGSHLPDLGGSRNIAEQGEQGAGRIEFVLFPSYTPSPLERQDPALSGNHEMRRAGFIQIFRLNFGRSEKDKK